MKEFGREVDGARQARDDMQVTFQEKLKNQETYILRLKEALARSERSRRSAEAERDELQDEISKGTTEKSVLLDGLLRMEARITCSQLEDEKSRKALELLHMEHTSENAFLTSENAFLTSVNAFLKEQLDMETKKLNTVNLAKRRLENKQNEIARGREAARRPVEGAGYMITLHVDNMNARKGLKRQVDVDEAVEVARKNALKRKLHRELDDLIEQNEPASR